MICKRGVGRAYFGVSNTSLTVTIYVPDGPDIDLDCKNLRGGNGCSLTSTIVRDITRGAYFNDPALMQSGFAAACTILDPA